MTAKVTDSNEVNAELQIARNLIKTLLLSLLKQSDSDESGHGIVVRDHIGCALVNMDAYYGRYPESRPGEVTDKG